MRKYYEQRYRSLTTSTLVRFAQAQSTSSDQNNSSDTATQFSSKQQTQLEQKAFELIGSPEIYHLLEDKAKDLLEKPVDDFIEKNKGKASVYLSNPEELMNDVTQQVPLIKYLRWLDNALDAAMIASSVISLVGLVASFGTASEVIVPAEMAKWTARGLIKKFIEKEGLQLLTKFFVQQVLAKIPSLALKGTVAFGKNFLKQALLQAKMLIIVDVLLSIVQTTTTNALKDVLATKGVEEFGLPQSVVTNILQPENDQQAVQQILSNFRDKLIQDLQNLFTTEQGLKNIGFNAAIATVLGVANINSSTLQKSILTSINLGLKDRNLAGRASQYIEQQKKLLQTPIKVLTKDDLLTMIKQRGLPELLVDNYYSLIVNKLQQQQALEDKNKAEDIAKKQLDKASLLMYDIQNQFKELATLQFILQYKVQLQKDPLDLQNLLQFATGSKTESLQSLLLQTKAKSFEDLIDNLSRQKKHLISSLTESLALDSSNSKKQQLFDIFEKRVDMEEYKRRLHESTLAVS